MKIKIIAVLLTLGILAASAPGASAAMTASVPTAAHADAGLVAADYTPVGSGIDSDEALPSAYSSRELGYTTPVRTQVFNTCWAYSSMAALETVLNKQGVGAGHLSTMEMNYREVTNPDGTGWQRGIGDAGYPLIALGHLTSLGAFTTQDFSDDASYDDYLLVRDSLKPYVYADTVIYLDGKDRDSVKTAVLRCGAAVANFHQNYSFLNTATSAYYCDIEYLATAELYGHAVAIVGWDDSFSRENFVSEHRPAHDGAWLCKNSWGEGFGSMGGYLWISYEDHFLFESRFGPSYAIAGVSLASDRIRMQQDELYGASYEFNYLNGDDSLTSATYANVLDFSDEFSVIDKVIFETTAEGASYEVFYIPLAADGAPTSDESAWTLLDAGKVAYQGYLCADIEDFAAPYEKAAIGVRITRSAPGGLLGIGVDEWLTTSRRTIFLPQSERGMSYLIGSDGGFVDVMDYYHDVLEDEIGGTFVIKALSYTNRITGDVDHDNSVSILDVTWIQRYLVELETFSEVQELVADYDADGVITILDGTRIQRMLAGIIA